MQPLNKKTRMQTSESVFNDFLVDWMGGMFRNVLFGKRTFAENCEFFDIFIGKLRKFKTMNCSNVKVPTEVILTKLGPPPKCLVFKCILFKTHSLPPRSSVFVWGGGSLLWCVCCLLELLVVLGLCRGAFSAFIL